MASKGSRNIKLTGNHGNKSKLVSSKPHGENSGYKRCTLFNFLLYWFLLLFALHQNEQSVIKRTRGAEKTQIKSKCAAFVSFIFIHPMEKESEFHRQAPAVHYKGIAWAFPV